MALDPRILKVNPDGSYLYRDTIPAKKFNFDGSGGYRAFGHVYTCAGDIIRIPRPGETQIRVDRNIERSTKTGWYDTNEQVTLSDIFSRYGFYPPENVYHVNRTCGENTYGSVNYRGYGVRLYYHDESQGDSRQGLPTWCNLHNLGSFRGHLGSTIRNFAPSGNDFMNLYVTFLLFPEKNRRPNYSDGMYISMYLGDITSNRESLESIVYLRSLRQSIFNTFRMNWCADNGVLVSKEELDYVYAEDSDYISIQ